MTRVMTPIVKEKLWGVTRPVDISPTHELHHATIKAGGFSSQHCHHRKFNGFYVVSGTLLVHFYRRKGDATPYDTGRAEAGSSVIAVWDEWHRFEAVTDVELIEWYFNDHVDPTDIERYDEGGLTPPSEDATQPCPTSSTSPSKPSKSPSS
ncbi:MAG: hypothetical protein KGZ65_02555 [Sphingomonadales bacterium]|nr:hypothetical protein [Sphingomonadaceae bacterium]MBS3930086.1 hypothetical protein [Sphingomonadales bacterium]